MDLSVRLLEDLKEARERLNQNPDNSSRSPSSCTPWFRESSSSDAPASSPPTDSADQDKPAEDPQVERESSKKEAGSTPPRPPGKQPGAPGGGRTQVLPVKPYRQPLSGDLCALRSGASGRILRVLQRLS